jgi:hypothetical protein
LGWIDDAQFNGDHVVAVQRALSRRRAVHVEIVHDDRAASGSGRVERRREPDVEVHRLRIEIEGVVSP